jgi:hypothetical protein
VACGSVPVRARVQVRVCSGNHVYFPAIFQFRYMRAYTAFPDRHFVGTRVNANLILGLFPQLRLQPTNLPSAAKLLCRRVDVCDSEVLMSKLCFDALLLPPAIPQA